MKGKMVVSVIRALAVDPRLRRVLRIGALITIALITLNNEVLVPYAEAFGLELPTVELSPEVWSGILATLLVPEKRGEKKEEVR